MSKIFNVTGNCRPEIHYMIDLNSRLMQIKEMVDQENYFTINRARQYGKTTILRALVKYLETDYTVVSLDFQMLSSSKFKNENIFSITFAKYFTEKLEANIQTPGDDLKNLLFSFQSELHENKDEFELFELFQYLSNICRISVKPIVLLIDEVDSATNNQVFLDFLAQLREYYLNRDETPTFQSVILASVYDVKNIKRKIRPDDEHRVNSPWNIAVDFLVDMSFSVAEIARMLEEYEKDYDTGMDISAMANQIYDYTSGYPFLVSRICKLLDERVAKGTRGEDKSAAWTREGFKSNKSTAI